MRTQGGAGASYSRGGGGPGCGRSDLGVGEVGDAVIGRENRTGIDCLEKDTTLSISLPVSPIPFKTKSRPRMKAFPGPKFPEPNTHLLYLSSYTHHP